MSRTAAASMNVPPTGASLQLVEQWLLWFLFALFCLFPLCQREIAVWPIGLMLAASAVAWRQKLHAALALGIAISVSSLVFVYVAGLPLVAFGVGLGVWWLLQHALAWPPQHKAWFARGDMGRGNLLACLACALLAALALLAWQRLAHPDLDDLLRQLPRQHPSLTLLIPGALLFAAGNALAEEAVYRGLLQHVLGLLVGRRVVWLLQAAAFGLMHVHGFPRGVLGVLLATVYGLMMGAVRLRAGGLLAPWLAHTLTDLSIVAILYTALPA